ncbi:MAG: hypothetical protein N2691_04690 [Patescibacteria group bacterium]|nr:hypothetical protein [Patescibacteria group bacterium]
MSKETQHSLSLLIKEYRASKEAKIEDPLLQRLINSAFEIRPLMDCAKNRKYDHPPFGLVRRDIRSPLQYSNFNPYRITAENPYVPLPEIYTLFLDQTAIALLHTLEREMERVSRDLSRRLLTN